MLNNHAVRVFLKLIAKPDALPVCIEYLTPDGKALFEGTEQRTAEFRRLVSRAQRRRLRRVLLSLFK
jgi:hypothetical protein